MTGRGVWTLSQRRARAVSCVSTNPLAFWLMTREGSERSRTTVHKLNDLCQDSIGNVNVVAQKPGTAVQFGAADPRAEC